MTGRPPTPLEERFWPKVDKGQEDECWEWIAAKTGAGYGQILAYGKQRGAHRVSYRIHNEDPEDSLVLHKCGNRSCVNPNHLYAVDYSNNMKDSIEHGTHQWIDPDRDGEDNPRSELTEDKVIEIRKLVDEGTSMMQVSRDMDIPYGRVKSAIENWSHL